jgi:hypothetical protein
MYIKTSSDGWKTTGDLAIGNELSAYTKISKFIITPGQLTIVIVDTSNNIYAGSYNS